MQKTKSKPNSNILEIQNLKKYYFSSFGANKAIDNVSFNLQKGKIIGLIGESGSGKTTTAHTIMGLLKQYNGIIKIDGRTVSSKMNKANRKWMRSKIQMIFQNPYTALNERKNVLSLLKEPLVANDILKREYEKMFLSWNKVKESYKLELGVAFYNGLLKLEKKIIKITLPYYQKLQEDLTSLELGKTKSKITENVEYILSIYFQDRNTANSEILGLYGQTIKNLFAFYQKKQEQIINLQTDDKLEKKIFPLQKQIIEIDKKLAFLKKNLKKQKWSSLRNSKKIYANHIKEEIKTLHTLMILSKTKLKYFKNKTNAFIHKMILLEIRKILGKVFKDQKHFQLKVFKLLNYHQMIFNKTFHQVELSPCFSYKEFKKLKEEIKHYVLKIVKTKNLKSLKEENQSTFAFEEQTKEQRKTSIKKLILQKKELEKKLKPLVKENKEEQKDLYETKVKKIIEKLKNQKRDFTKKFESDLANIKKETQKMFYVKANNIQKNIQANIKNLKHRKPKGYKARVHKFRSLLQVFRENIKNNEKLNFAFDQEVTFLKKDLFKIKILFGYQKHFFSKMQIKSFIVKTRISDALESVGLKREFASRYPHEFSGGQRQRIVIARALIAEPEIIVADEPVASLDVSIQAQVVNLLTDLATKQNISIIFIAHDLTMIEYIADELQIMHLGKIVESGSKKKIFKNPVHPYTRNLFQAIPKMEDFHEEFFGGEFAETYLSEYKQEMPEMVEIEKNHFVLASKKQLGKWKNVV